MKLHELRAKYTLSRPTHEKKATPASPICTKWLRNEVLWNSGIDDYDILTADLDLIEGTFMELLSKHIHVWDHFSPWHATGRSIDLDAAYEYNGAGVDIGVWRIDRLKTSKNVDGNRIVFVNTGSISTEQTISLRVLLERPIMRPIPGRTIKVYR